MAVERDAAGNVRSVEGHLSNGLGFDLASVTPRLSGARAVEALRQHAGLLPYGIGINAVSDTSLQNLRHELYVYAEGRKARLVYLTRSSPTTTATRRARPRSSTPIPAPS